MFRSHFIKKLTLFENFENSSFENSLSSATHFIHKLTLFETLKKKLQQHILHVNKHLKNLKRFCNSKFTFYT